MSARRRRNPHRTAAIAARLVAFGLAMAPCGPSFGQPPAAPAANAPAASTELFAPNLGISYQLVPYGPALGARLTRYPLPGSPAAQLQLEPGDMIVTLDGQAIRGPNDVLAHASRTDVIFINIRTGLPQAGVVFIPTPSPPAEPVTPLGPYSLGIYTVPILLMPTPFVQRPGQPPIVGPGAQAPRPGLRVTSVGIGGPASRRGMLPGDVIVEANGFPMETNESLRRVTATSGGVVTLDVARRGVYEDIVRLVIDMRPTPVPGGAAAPPPSPAPGR